MRDHPAFRVGFRALLRDRATLFFMLFVAIVVMLLLALDGIRRSQQGNVFAPDDRLLIVSNAIAPRYPLPLRYVNELKSANLGVQGVAAMTFVPATYSSSRQNVPVIAVEPADFLATNTDVVVWSEMAERWLADPDSILIGQDLANHFNLKIGDSMALTSSKFSVVGIPTELRLKISGLYTVKDQAYPAYGIVLHDRLIRPYGQRAVADGANSLLVLLEGREDHTRVSAAIDRKYENGIVPTRTFLREEYVEKFRSQGEAITGAISLYGITGVLAGVLLMGAFCYYNAEHLRRATTDLRLLGFSRPAVLFNLAAAQTSVVAGGVLVGVVLALTAEHLFSHIIRRNFPMFEFSHDIVVVLLGSTTATAFALSCLALCPVVLSSRKPGMAERYA